MDSIACPVLANKPPINEFVELNKSNPALLKDETEWKIEYANARGKSSGKSCKNTGSPRPKPTISHIAVITNKRLTNFTISLKLLKAMAWETIKRSLNCNLPLKIENKKVKIVTV